MKHAHKKSKDHIDSKFQAQLRVEKKEYLKEEFSD